MANNTIQIKRTSVSGRAANTTTLPNPGELAINMTDGIMYSTNGSVVFEIGANNTTVNVSNSITLQSNLNMVSPDGNNTITVNMLNSDTLSFSGNTGQLFSITDSQNGVIFAVNDISGVPSIEVDDDGTIRLAETFGNVLIGTNTDNGTDKLQVNGSISATSISGNGASITSVDAATVGGNTATDLRSYSDTTAATAYSNAVSTAATDATNKAANAYSNAVSYADSIAATAYSNATSYADTAAGTAYSNAVSYADSLPYVNTVQLSSNLSNYALLSGATFTGNVSVNTTLTVNAISANGSTGAAGQVLTTNGSNVYWSAVSGGGGGTVTQVNTGVGLIGGPIDTTGTISVNPNTGIIANASGLFVNAAYIATLDANNASYLGGLTSSQFLRSDADDTATGVITFSANVISNSTLDANVITVDTLQILGGTGTQGTITWNTDEETIDIVQNGATLQVGQEIHYHVKNQTGNTILDGTAVRAVGTLGSSGRILAAPMVANGSVDSKYYIGIATEDIPDGTDGKVTHFGKIRGLDLSTYSEGDILWLDPSTAGGLTTTEPSAPNLKVATAIVVSNSATVGEMFVRVETGNVLHELHDVEAAAATNNQFLVYDNVDGRWESRTANTTIVDEGTNLYYTVARANSAIDARVTKTFVDALNVDAATVGGNTAATLRSYSDTTAATSYSNAVSYVGAQSYVNTAQLSGNLSNYALLSGATFTGVVTVNGNTVLGAGLSANGGFGTAGQVLTTNGTVAYWSTVSGGGYYFGDNGTVGDATNANNIFRVNNNSLNANVTFANGQNGSCAGPLTVANGVTLTIQSGARVAIV